MSDRVMSLALTTFLLVLVLAMSWMALDFNEQARRVPLVVGVPTAIALALQVIRELLGFRLGAEFADAQVDEGPATVPVEGAVATTQVLDVSAEAGPAADSDFNAGGAPGDAAVAEAEDPSTAERATRGSRTERTEIAAPKVSAPQAFAWVVFLGISFYLFGMMATVPVFLVPFMRIYGSESWKTIVGIVLGTMGVLHVLFVMLLEVRLFTGVIGERSGL